jgi:hypothetical protein
MPSVTVYVVRPPSEVVVYRKLRDAVSFDEKKVNKLSSSTETWTLTFDTSLTITDQNDATWRSSSESALRDGASYVGGCACVSDSHPTCPVRVVRAWLPSSYRVHPS